MKKYFLEELCPGVEKVHIKHWDIEAGTVIEAGTKIADFETTKVNFEVYAPNHGKVIELYALAGSEVDNQKPLFSLEED